MPNSTGSEDLLRYRSDATGVSPDRKRFGVRIAYLEGVQMNEDAFLQGLLKLAEFGTSTPITLHSGGLVVTGELINPKKYIESIAGVFEASGTKASGDTAKNLKALSKAFLSAVQGSEAEGADVESEFIHLKNARFLIGDKFPQGDGGMYWRGRADSITSFFLGSIVSHAVRR
jgi:hypothetical protein